MRSSFGLASLSLIVPSFGKSAFVPTSTGPLGAAAAAGASAAWASSHMQHAHAATAIPAAAVTKSRRFKSDIVYAPWLRASPHTSAKHRIAILLWGKMVAMGQLDP